MSAHADSSHSRPLRIAAWAAAVLIGLPVALAALLLAVILVGANTGAGRRLIERQATSLTGGLVGIEGLGGRFPDSLTVARITVSDARGPWLAIDRLVLDWSPLRLLAGTVHVELARADRIDAMRLPVPAATGKPAPPPRPGARSGLHLGILVDRLQVDRLTVAAAIVAPVPASTAGGAAATGGQAIAAANPDQAIAVANASQAIAVANASQAIAVAIDGHVRIADLAPLLDGAALGRLPDTDLGLQLVRLDHPGNVDLAATVAPSRLALHLRLDDPAGGAVTALAHVPPLDPLHLALDLDGPRDAERLLLSGSAGAPATGVLTLGAHGTVDLLRPRFDLALAVHAPAMQPMPGIAWTGVALDAHLVGTPQDPAGQGTLVLDELAAAGAGIDRLTARLDGTPGPVHLHAVADGLRIPGPQPALLAAAPLTLDATLDPHAAGRPLDLAVSHPLLGVGGHVLTAAPQRGQLTLHLPDLAPFAAIGGTALAGHADLSASFSLDGQKADLSLSGPIAITGGQPQAVGLVGPDGHLALAVSRDGAALALRQLQLDGQALHLAASGTDRSDVLDARFSLGLPSLQQALPSLRGALAVAGTASGPLHDLAAHLTANGDPGTATMATGPLHLVLDAQHLPSAPAGTVSLAGSLDRAPLALRADAARLADGALHLTLDALSWKSAGGRADLTLPAGARVPLGTLDLRMARLADLRPVIGQPISGSVQASLRTSQAPGAAPRIGVDVRGNGGLQAAHVARLALAGTVDDPLGAPAVALRLDVAGLQAGAITGSAHATARGPQTALDVAAQARLQNVAGGPANLDTMLRLDLPHREVAVSRLAADARGEALRLLSPARIAFGARIAVDRLRLSLAPPGVAPASIDVAGEIKPRLDLTARIDGVTPALAKPFVPTLDAAGLIAAEARLTGTLAAPRGSVRFTGSGLRLRTGPAASLPPGSLVAEITLAGSAARLDARLEAGPKVALSVDGTAPTSATGPLALRTAGRLDLALANAVLGAQGREADGILTLDLGVSGTARAPRLDGTAQLAGGQVLDYAQGLRLTDISALVRASGQTLSIDGFTAHAGGGTIGASGTVGALVPGLPVDLRITAHQARPLSSDLLTAVLDADIRAHGLATSRLDVGGTLTIDGASINVPNGLPPSVARLDVIRPGQRPPSPAAAKAPALLIGLDLGVEAPGQIFVRGHGLDAELGGALHVGGTSAAPAVSGAFDMRRGSFDLAGISLTFTKGRVGFNGAGVGHRIDPALDFTAQSVVGSTVAMLNVGGYASAPKISLSSTPPLPQDQVLALILFGQDTKSLSALQIAQVAAALASLTGSGGGGFDPLGTVRKSLGLDRLSIGGGNDNAGASVEAGKYVARGVYVGAKQATSGGGSQAEVQIDLTRRLKLLTTVGTGGATTGVITPENDPGSSVALKYQFQY